MRIKRLLQEVIILYKPTALFFLIYIYLKHNQNFCIRKLSHKKVIWKHVVNLFQINMSLTFFTFYNFLLFICFFELSFFFLNVCTRIDYSQPFVRDRHIVPFTSRTSTALTFLTRSYFPYCARTIFSAAERRGRFISPLLRFASRATLLRPVMHVFERRVAETRISHLRCYSRAECNDLRSICDELGDRLRATGFGHLRGRRASLQFLHVSRLCYSCVFDRINSSCIQI